MNLYTTAAIIFVALASVASADEAPCQYLGGCNPIVTPPPPEEPPAYTGRKLGEAPAVDEGEETADEGGDEAEGGALGA